MTDEQERKKNEFAKISPVKMEKAMSALEIEAHKKQLEQYYSGQTVDEIEKIISDSKQDISAVGSSKLKLYMVKFYMAVLVFVFFWLGVLLSYLLDK